MKRTWSKFLNAFMARVAIEELNVHELQSELSKGYEAYPKVINKWRMEFL